jgi:hypothetical protein
MNPENGTTTHAYAGDMLNYEVDAKGQKIPMGFFDWAAAVSEVG